MKYARKEVASHTQVLTGLAHGTETAVLRVIIVNYRQWKSTAHLVALLQKSHAYRSGKVELVVVDNNSPVHSSINRLADQPRVKVLLSRKNRGFARGVNAGAEGNRAPWILLLNPDISVGEGFLDQVLEVGGRLRESEERLGAVGFGMLDPEGTNQPTSGPFPTLINTLLRLALPRRYRKYDLLGPNHGEVDWLSGCCLLITRECWQSLNQFDPDFFLYYEDVDFCRRAASQNWKVILDRSVTAIHHHPLHRRRVPPHLRVATRMALHTYARKHWGRIPFTLISLVLFAEASFHLGLSRRRGHWEAESWWATLRQLISQASRGKPAQATRKLFHLLGSGDLHRKG